MRGTDCFTDHQLRPIIQFFIRAKHKKSGFKASEASHQQTGDSRVQAALEELNRQLMKWEQLSESLSVEDAWPELKSSVYVTALSILERPERAHQD